MLRSGTYKLQIFEEKPGKSPYLNWLGSLHAGVQARIYQRVERLKSGQFGDYKRIDENLYELRLFFGPGYRVYFGEEDGNFIVLLAGGDKSTQNRDIAKARMYWKICREDHP